MRPGTAGSTTNGLIKVEEHGRRHRVADRVGSAQAGRQAPVDRAVVRDVRRVNYRGQRLTHEPPDELVSEQVTLRVWRPHLTRSLFFIAIILVVGTIGTLVGVIGAFANAADQLGSGSSGSGGFLTGLYYLLLFV